MGPPSGGDSVGASCDEPAARVVAYRVIHYSVGAITTFSTCAQVRTERAGASTAPAPPAPPAPLEPPNHSPEATCP